MKTGELKSWIITEDYVAPHRGSGQSRQFKKGEKVTGTAYIPQAAANVRAMPMVVVDDNYLVPATHIAEYVSKTGGQGSVVAEASIVPTVKKVSGSAGFKKGALLGGIAGAGFSFFKGKNIMVYGIMGVLIGGTIGYLYYENEKKEAV
ncbi:MAG TPA: hypothetical protein PKZ07_14635 [Sedimentisphaerales bacterium]|nr:hypothetical protein [Sedimentisphaerales bacterium]